MVITGLLRKAWIRTWGWLDRLATSQEFLFAANQTNDLIFLEREEEPI